MVRDQGGETRLCHFGLTLPIDADGACCKNRASRRGSQTGKSERPSMSSRATLSSVSSHGVLEIEMTALSDVGRLRANNEDAVAVDPRRGLAILADGLGGYKAGEIASGMAVAILAGTLGKALDEREKMLSEEDAARVRDLMREAIARANAAIHQAGRLRPECAGMATTLVLAVFLPRQVLIAHVGDSRLYRWREGRLECLTRDHAWPVARNAWETAGQVVPSLAGRLITRALGADSRVSVDFTSRPLAKGDVFLLCSDGLSDMLDDDDIRLALAEGIEPLSECNRRLVRAANARGGKDNVSVILCRVRERDLVADVEREKAWVSSWDE